MQRNGIQKLDDAFKLDEIIKKEKTVLKNCNKSNLIYSSIHSFYKYYYNSKKCNNLCLKSKYLFLAKFLNDLNKFKKLKTIK